MKQVIIIRFGEIFLKGDNKYFFEKKLFENIEKKLSKFDCKLVKIQSRLLVEDFNESSAQMVISALKKVFGIQSVSLAYCVRTDMDEIKEAAKKLLKEGSFKVETNRADKTFPLKSPEICREVGGFLLNICTNVHVNVTNPEQIIRIDIRENGHSYICAYVENCERGMPYATGGRAVAMLSGGIDSPVAAYQMAKRGMEIVLLHFHSFPYTSDMAREKVLNLAKKLCGYVGKMRIHMVSATDFQKFTAENCHGSYQITLLRRFMVKVANEICKKEGALAIVTGESLAQVASQTAEGIFCTNEVASFPILRPLIGTDKQDIIEIAQKIDTYEISIQPYEDCCTVFLPKNPITKPKLENVLKEEENIDYSAFVEKALQECQTLTIDEE